MIRLLICFVVATAIGTGCSSKFNSKEDIAALLNENPEIISEVIEKNPEKIMLAIRNAAKTERKIREKKRVEEEKKKLEQAYLNPLQPEIKEDTLIRGDKKAPIILVVYCDFECPYCQRAFNTVTELRKKYENKIQVIYKHLPLSFHKNAMLIAKYYEAIGMQSAEMAFKFHDSVYNGTAKLKQNADSFLQDIIKSLNLDMDKLKRDLDSEKVKMKIKVDISEAKKFKINGTPGFILNGIPVKGAYPVDHFEGIIKELIKRGKLKI